MSERSPVFNSSSVFICTGEGATTAREFQLRTTTFPIRFNQNQSDTPCKQGKKNYCKQLVRKFSKIPSASPGRGGWSLPSPLQAGDRPALPALLFSCVRAELLLGTSGTKGLAHFYSTHMPARRGTATREQGGGGPRAD